jgi:hypothetical protein
MTLSGGNTYLAHDVAKLSAKLANDDVVVEF